VNFGKVRHAIIPPHRQKNKQDFLNFNSKMVKLNKKKRGENDE